ncbi:TerD family protein [Pseudomonas putida]|uniref:TerD domain-containing protein n=1 Tax=Pseudomonas putida TaxID=303 RepID=A0A1Q9R3H4_PSEPU|nr:TerD family protein [Pseudomonas putida]OLS61931.1 hypothetical protein PSEMO_28330 [Pseudomonas putida]
MSTLTPGGNVAVTGGQLRVAVHFSPGIDLDCSAFALDASGKVRGDDDMCFYGQPSILGGAVQLGANAAGKAQFDIDLQRLDPQVEKIALTATFHENKGCFDQLATLALSVTGGIDAQIPTRGMSESALILGELYRRQGNWKLRCVGQGFVGGLEPLARHFGVDIATPAPAPTPTPTPAPTASVSLSKVSLDKTRSSISLDKSPTGFGEIRVNLDWKRSPGAERAKGGLFGGLLGKRSTAVDLDLGCLFELRDGYKGVVQALGNSFGDLVFEPYIKLMGDDRTGSLAGGEWLHINGQKWSEIRRILIFAYIYEGAPDWKATDGVVTLHVPGQPDIEVRMNEEGGRHGMCAIALLENIDGAAKVSRRIDFHRGHKDLDRAYDWGMRWTAGSK